MGKIKIAAFGRKESTDRLLLYAKDNDHIEIVPIVYHYVNDIANLIDHVIHYDVYLFTEAFPYRFIEHIVKDKRLPAVTVAYDEYMLLTALFHLLQEGRKALTRLSIDAVSRLQVKKVLRDLNIQSQDIYSIDYGESSPVDVNRIVSFHQELWNEGKIDYVLTTVYDVAERLNELNIPNKRIPVPMINMIEAIDRCISLVQLNQQTNGQIVAGYFRVKQKSTLPKQRTPYENLKTILENFAKQTHASLVRINESEYVMFGTEGILQYIKRHFRHFPLLEDLKQHVAMSIDIGFGLGLNAKQAETHARIALDSCKQSPKTCCYLVNEQQETIGPIGVKKHVDTAKLYQALIHKARLNNETSYHFIDFITLRNNEPFSSHDVADYYQVTKRSAERTINKLLSGNVIKIVGEEKPYTRGRPRKLYKVE